jgi:hypothetical protein
MTYGQIRELTAKVRQIPLAAVLSRLGAQPERHDHSKWRTEQGTLSVTGAKFMNWRQGSGGGGAIDLVLHLRGGGFKDAVAWLRDNFPDASNTTTPQQSAESCLRLPTIVPDNLARVCRYLSEQRGLPPDLLEPLIDAGSLYADNRANAVFLLRDATSLPVGAELRGTTAMRWRGLSSGSRKDLGYFSVGPATAAAIVLCESAIDALSFLTLHPAAYCISTSGATPNPRWLPRLLAKSKQIYCAFDSDEAGDHYANAIIALYPAIKRLRPCKHDWNDELRGA